MFATSCASLSPVKIGATKQASSGSQYGCAELVHPRASAIDNSRSGTRFSGTAVRTLFVPSCGKRKSWRPRCRHASEFHRERKQDGMTSRSVHVFELVIGGAHEFVGGTQLHSRIDLITNSCEALKAESEIMAGGSTGEKTPVFQLGINAPDSCANERFQPRPRRDPPLHVCEDRKLQQVNRALFKKSPVNVRT